MSRPDKCSILSGHDPLGRKFSADEELQSDRAALNATGDAELGFNPFAAEFVFHGPPITLLTENSGFDQRGERFRNSRRRHAELLRHTARPLRAAQNRNQHGQP